MDVGVLHFLRPGWLWALTLLPLWLWVAVRRARAPDLWRGVVDAKLMPHLLATAETPARRRGWWWGGVAYGLAVLALAGPSWRLAEQPVWRQQSPLVVAMDLSTATLQRDLPPSRLAQARGKLGELLKLRQGGQVGLVAYAGDAFTVAPLTDDANNVAVFLDALAPDVMPEDGQRLDRAIAWSTRLLRQGGHARGDILVMADHATDSDIAAAATAAATGIRVSALGVGAAAGDAASSGFDEASLRRLAAAGGGRYRRISLDDADLHDLGILVARGAAQSDETDRRARDWKDEGYWLLPVVMLLVLPLFRRGVAMAALFVAVGLPLGKAQAADWWRREDQVQHATMAAATQRYRQGDYEGAAKGFAQVDSADGHYNRGNALAKAGRYREAIQAYDRALERAPGMADAIANRRAVEAAMKRPSTSGPQGGRPSSGQSGSKDSTAGGQGRDGTGDASGNASGPPDGHQGAPEASGDGGAARPSEAATTEPPAGQRPASGDATAPAPGAKPADAARQAQADTAQRARMTQAMSTRGSERGDARASQSTAARTETAQARERRIANEAWLRRVPDDPGGLLREKFRLEHQRRLQQGGASP